MRVLKSGSGNSTSTLPDLSRVKTAFGRCLGAIWALSGRYLRHKNSDESQQKHQHTANNRKDHRCSMCNRLHHVGRMRRVRIAGRRIGGGLMMGRHRDPISCLFKQCFYFTFRRGWLTPPHECSHEELIFKTATDL